MTAALAISVIIFSEVFQPLPLDEAVDLDPEVFLDDTVSVKIMELRARIMIDLLSSLLTTRYGFVF
ncbi:MAG: hypothetical protein K8S24_11015 [Candidatus Aegiribacteria sp.]|nr:hypothetical protein [Candidatus Aegiribacteria sp.]